MCPKRRLVLALAVVLGFSLLPSIAFAESFTLPAKTFALGTWYEPYAYQQGRSWSCDSGSGDYNEVMSASNVEGWNYYDQKWHLYWRVAIAPDGTERIIDYYLFDGHQATRSEPGPGWYRNRDKCSSDWRQYGNTISSATVTVPEATVDLSGGLWRIELRHTVISTPTAARFQNITPDSVVDWWEGIPIEYARYSYHRDKYNSYRSNYETRTRACTATTKTAFEETGMFVFLDLTTYHTAYDSNYGYDASVSTSCEQQGMKPLREELRCKFEWSWSLTRSEYWRKGNSYSEHNKQGCWVENKTATNVRIADRSDLLEYYEVEVVQEISNVAQDVITIEKSNFTVVSVSSPFNTDMGDSQESGHDGADVTVAAVAGIGALGAGTYLAGRYSTRSGSVFRTFKTALGDAAESALAAQRKYMDAVKQAYLDRLAKKAAEAKERKRLEGLQSARKDRVDSLNSAIAAVNGMQFLDEKSRMLGKIRQQYTDILTPEADAQLASAADKYYAGWTGIVNAPAAAKVNYVKPFVAKEDDPAQGKTLWNKFTGAMSGLGKLIWNGAQNRAKYYGQLWNTVKEGDFKGAAGLWLERTKKDYELLADTVKEHWVQIAIGVVAGIAIVATLGLATPAIAVALGVSTVAVEISAATIGAGGAVYYGAKTYGPMLNRVNDTCSWSGCTTEGEQNIRDVKEQLLADELTLAGGLGGGAVSSKFIVKPITTGLVVNHPNVLKVFKTFLKTRNTDLVYDNEFLDVVQKRVRAAYTFGDTDYRVLTYGDRTRFSDLMHDIIHSTDHAKAGFPTSSQMAKVNVRKIYGAKTEINAYLHELENAERYGLTQTEIYNKIAPRIINNLITLIQNSVDLKTIENYNTLKKYGFIK